jgi:ubiquinone/menaquinone biosynthesis C-methylase UbiE
MDALERMRVLQVLPHVRGRLLDLGCGFNNIVRLYGNGVGADVHPWSGAQVLIGDSSQLPFSDSTFDTVTIVAALNHIPNRHQALQEVWRVLASDGRLIVTMIGPMTGRIAHLLFGQDEKTRGGLKEGEKVGMTSPEVQDLLSASGFVLERTVPFEFHLNRLYIAAKA